MEWVYPPGDAGACAVVEISALMYGTQPREAIAAGDTVDTTTVKPTKKILVTPGHTLTVRVERGRLILAVVKDAAPPRED